MLTVDVKQIAKIFISQNCKRRILYRQWLYWWIL